MSSQPIVEPLPQSDPPVWLRWTVMLFLALAMFGNYYIYDSLSPVADLLKSQLGFSDAQIGLLNTFYSLASLPFLFLGGILIDRLGIRKGILLFTAIAVVGSLVMAWGGGFAVMGVGRGLFGMGAEAMIVAITAALAKWFKGKELGLAFGLNLMVGRFGSWMAFRSPGFAESLYDSWQWPLLLASGIGLTCLIGALVYWILESGAEKNYRLGKAGETDQLVLAEMFKFKRSYWYIVALCATFYSAVFPFQTFMVKFLMESHGLERDTAGAMGSWLPFISMIFTPIFGLASDWFGKRSYMMIFGSILLLPVYLMLVYTPITPYIPFAMLGIAYALIPAVMWPSVAYVVKESRLGTAYALMTMIQQLGVALFNFLVGSANDYQMAGPDNPSGYGLGMWLFSVLGFAGLFFAFQLRRAEAGPEGHGLDTIRAGSPQPESQD